MPRGATGATMRENLPLGLVQIAPRGEAASRERVGLSPRELASIRDCPGLCKGLCI